MLGRTIALFLRTITNAHQELLRDDFVASAPKHDFAIEVHDAENDSDKQLRQIRASIRDPASRPVAVFVSPVRESGLLGAAYEVARLGMGWVVLNRSSDYLRDLRDQFPKPPVFCVNADQTQVGRIQGRQFKALLPTGGELFYLRGPPTTSSAQKRLAGVEQELEGSSIRKVSASADWSGEGVPAATKKWVLQNLRNRDCAKCLVGAQNDHMAMAARGALLEEARSQSRPELGRIPLTGCDGTPKYGQQLVARGDLVATVVIPSTAERAIDELNAALRGGKPPPLEVVLGVSSYPVLEDLSPV